MNYLDTYKRLDNLCKDLLQSDRGITSYIESMERVENARYYVSNWNEDYRKLKRLRYIRNQIVHENYATEDNMCDADDIKWVEHFHQRIIDRTDPLALYCKARTPYKQKPKSIGGKSPMQSRQSKEKISGWLKFLIVSCAIIEIICIIMLIDVF